MDLNAIADRIVATAPAGVTGYAETPTEPTYPCFVIGPFDPINYRERHNGRSAELTITLYCSMASGVGPAVRELRGLLSWPDGLPASIEVDEPGLEVRVGVSVNHREVTLSATETTDVDLVAADLTVSIRTREDKQP